MASTPATQALVAVPPVKRRLLWTLGLGAFGLAFSLTTTAAYLPPLLSRFTSSGGLIGVILGAEGVFALLISPVIGPWSDSFHTPLGRRPPFILAAVLTTTACGLTILLVREDGGHGRVFEGFAAYVRRSWSIFWQDGDVRRFLLANSAWEGTFAAARTFVVLYVIHGLHQSK